MNEFNRRTAMNYQLRQDARDTVRQQRKARFRIEERQLTAAIRQHNRLIALDMTLAGVLGMALGVLYCCIF